MGQTRQRNLAREVPPGHLSPDRRGGGHLRSVGSRDSLAFPAVGEHCRLGLDETQLRPWLAFWSGAHDIGKVSPCFQDRGKNNTGELRDTAWRPGSTFPRQRAPRQPQHQDSGRRAGTRDAMAVRSIRGVARNVAVAVGGHHGIFPTNWDGICVPLGNDAGPRPAARLLGELARLFGVTDLPPPSPTAADDQSVWMYVAGLTSVADWIGSNQAFFEPRRESRRCGRPVRRGRLLPAGPAAGATWRWKQLGWLGRANRPRASDVRGAVPRPFRTPRPLQTAVAEIVAEHDRAALADRRGPDGRGQDRGGLVRRRRAGTVAAARAPTSPCRRWPPATRCSTGSASSWKPDARQEEPDAPARQGGAERPVREAEVRRLGLRR